MRAPVSPGGWPGCEELLLLLLAGRPRLLGDPAPRAPPYTPSEQALEPWIPGSRKIRLEDAELWSQVASADSLRVPLFLEPSVRPECGQLREAPRLQSELLGAFFF